MAIAENFASCIAKHSAELAEVRKGNTTGSNLTLTELGGGSCEYIDYRRVTRVAKKNNAQDRVMISIKGLFTLGLAATFVLCI